MERVWEATEEAKLREVFPVVWGALDESNFIWGERLERYSTKFDPLCWQMFERPLFQNILLYKGFNIPTINKNLNLLKNPGSSSNYISTIFSKDNK